MTKVVVQNSLFINSYEKYFQLLCVAIALSSFAVHFLYFVKKKKQKKKKRGLKKDFSIIEQIKVRWIV